MPNSTRLLRDEDVVVMKIGSAPPSERSQPRHRGANSPVWKIVVSKKFGTETKVLFSSTSSTGFQTQLPANFGTLYPPSTWWREVNLTVHNPFGLAESKYLEF